MSIPHALRLSRAPAAALMAVGVVWGGLAASMPDIKAGVGASDAALGAVLLMSAVGGLLAMWGAPWVGRRLGRLALPVLVLIGLIFAMLTPKVLAATEDKDPTVPLRVPWMVICLTGLILFAAFIGENATEAWSAQHIERTLGAAAGHGSFGPAMLGLVMGIGHMSGQLAATRLGNARLIFWSVALGMIGALVIAVAWSPSVALFGVAVSGLGMAVIVPSANSILGEHVTERQRSHALSRAWMFGIFGFFIGPAIMGGVAELFGLRMSFVVVSLLVALILLAVVVPARRPVVAPA